MNKRHSQIYRAWENSRDYSLDHCFNSYSTAKARAWEYCEKLFHKYDGYGLKVISHNGWIFTAGFEFADPETGEIKFMYITPSKDEIFEGVEI